MKRVLLLISGAGAVVLVVCTAASCGGAKSGRGFHLPDGDIEKGREAFIQLQCNQCHTVVGVDLPSPSVAGPVQVKLGGEMFRVKTYGQLVTSIIAPSHIVSPKYREKFKGPKNPLMPNVSSAMTVRQMIDIVAFLHSRYTKIYPGYRDYSFPYAPYAPYGTPLYPEPLQTPPAEQK